MNDQARKIKFRGKCKVSGEYVYGVPIPNSFAEKAFIIPLVSTDTIAYPFERLIDWVVEVWVKTITQYTGLKDKNGVEIYEGDIVSHWGFVFAVVFQNGAFGRIEDGCFFPFYNYGEDDSKMFEVIGNIHENPEIEVSK